jgi:Calpain family cysteine protease
MASNVANNGLDQGLSPYAALQKNSLKPLEIKINSGSRCSNIISDAMQSTQASLQEFAAKSDFAASMNTAFGNSDVSKLQQSWSKGNFGDLPQIKISGELDVISANGAYASKTDTIYLSQSFVERNARNIGEIKSVLLEEIGHAVDFRINQQDAIGDEGAIFQRVAQGFSISDSELASLRGIQDFTSLVIDEKELTIERSSVQFSNTNNLSSGTGYTIKPGEWNNNEFPRTLAGVNGNGEADIGDLPHEHNPFATSGTDWFEENLYDQELKTLTRSLATDGLNRKDMISIFESVKDFFVVDNNELTDLDTLLKNSSDFSMTEDVRWLTDKVVQGSFVDMSSSQFQSSLVDKWFLGKAYPIANFDSKDENTNTTTTYNLNYVEVSGNLFGDSGQAKIGDIDQGKLGDCAFLAALGATFSPQVNDGGNAVSNVINNMIIDNHDNTYTMKFFKNRAAEYVTVDNRLATYDGKLFTSKSNGEDVDANNANVPLWVPLAQKAYAQWRESWGDGKSG